MNHVCETPFVPICEVQAGRKSRTASKTRPHRILVFHSKHGSPLRETKVLHDGLYIVR